MVQKTNEADIICCVSGAGRTLENLIEHSLKVGSFRIVGVVGSRPCRGLEVATAAGIDTFQGDFDQVDSFRSELFRWIADRHAAWIVLSGFLKKFPIEKEWEGRIINIHPSLLPKYGGAGMYGMHVHSAVIRSNDRVSGATVHFVDDEYDRGKIIARTRVTVREKDDAQSIADRVFKKECKLLPEVISQLVSKTLPLPGDKIYEV